MDVFLSSMIYVAAQVVDTIKITRSRRKKSIDRDGVLTQERLLPSDTAYMHIWADGEYTYMYRELLQSILTRQLA
jgi:hypothetical protein